MRFGGFPFGGDFFEGMGGMPGAEGILLHKTQ